METAEWKGPWGSRKAGRGANWCSGKGVIGRREGMTGRREQDVCFSWTGFFSVKNVQSNHPRLACNQCRLIHNRRLPAHSQAIAILGGYRKISAPTATVGWLMVPSFGSGQVSWSAWGVTGDPPPPPRSDPV